MKIMHRNLVNDDQHPILIQAANILSEWGFNKFRKHSFAPLKEYICMLNPSGCTLVYKKDVDEENKTDLRTFLPFQTRCECKCSKCYQIQCVHELSKYGKVIPNFFSKRWLRRDGHTKSTFIGSYKNPSTCDSLELTQECMEIEESGILDTWDDHDEVIDVDVNQNDTNVLLNESDNLESLTDDSMKKMLPIPKVSKKLNYQDFSSISNQLFNACERNSQYATFVGGMMLKLLSVVDKCQSETELSENIDENLTKHFPSIIDNYKCMFGDKSKSSNIVNNYAPARATNSHFATNKRLMSTIEKKKRESLKKRKVSGVNNTLFPWSSNNNDISGSDHCFIADEKYLNIFLFKSKKKNKRTCSFCKLSDHTILNCKQKLQYGNVSKSSEVMDYIRSKAPFKIVDQSKVNEIIYDWNVKLVQHVILHNIQCKINTNGIRPTINEMIVELTALGRNGQKIPGYIRCLVYGPQVFFYMTTKDHVKDRFIFNKIEEESVGNEYRISNTQVSRDMAQMMTNDNNMVTMPNNNMMYMQPSQTPNSNMMNGNQQYSLFSPQNMFRCQMIPVGYGPYNQMNQSNHNNNDGSPWLSN